MVANTEHARVIATHRSADLGLRLCPLIAFDQFVGGKYKLRTLWTLSAGPRRYGEIRRSVKTACQGKPVSARVLSRELKDLERRGLIARREHPGKQRCVEYEATEAGRKLDAVIQEIIAWGLTGAHEVSPALVQAAQRLGKTL